MCTSAGKFKEKSIMLKWKIFYIFLLSITSLSGHSETSTQDSIQYTSQEEQYQSDITPSVSGNALVNQQQGFHFQIIDMNKRVIRQLQNNDRVPMSSLPEFFNIEAVTPDTYASVGVKAVSEQYSISRVEKSPSWTITTKSRAFSPTLGHYEISATGYSLDRRQGEAGPTSTISFQIVEQHGFHFQIIDMNKRVIRQLKNNDLVPISSLPEFFNIEAVTADTYASVGVKASSELYSINRVEKSPSWTITTKSRAFSPALGHYEISATGYSLARRQGEVGPTSTINFQIVEQQGFHFQIIDKYNQVIRQLQNNDRVPMSSLPEFFNIEAVTPDTYASVSVKAISEQYSIYRVEKSPVWTITTKSRLFSPAPSNYEISATGYSLDRKQGKAGPTSTISFQIEYDTPVENTPPVAIDDAGITNMDTTIVINALSNDNDLETPELEITQATSEFGEVSVSNNNLSFTPEFGFLGKALIVYTISDGELTSTANVIVTVSDNTKRVSLAWEKPRERENGASLSRNEILAYHILYRQIGATEYTTLVIPEADTNTVTIENLLATEYEFKISTLDTNGVLSAHSNTLKINLAK